MKKVLITLALLATLAVADAASVSVQTPAGINPSILVSNACRVSQFVFNNTNLVNTAYYSIFDGPAVTTIYGASVATVGAYITNVVPSYTYVSLSSLLVTNVYTNYFGVVYNTNVQYQAVQHVTNTVAQTTNTYPLVFQIIVPTNTTYTVDYNQQFIRGVLCTNSGAGNITTVYTQ